MATIETIATNYRQRAERAEKEQRQVQQQIYRISLLRVLLFVGGIAAAIVLRHDGWWAWGGALAVTMLPFLALVKYHNRLFHRKDYLEKEAKINRQELAALNLDTSAFDDGAENIDPAHLYAFDLDVYGPRTLFPCLNRTCTQPGRTRLAAWLGQHLEDKEEIEARQAAVQELSTLTDFRQRFRILGLLHKGQRADEAELQAWSVSPTLFRCRPLLRVLPYVVGGANALCLLLVLAGTMSAAAWGTLWIAFAMLSFFFTGKVTRVQNVYGKKLQILGTYARLLRLMDEQPLQSKLLADIKEESGRASHAILRLSKLMNELDQRNNYLMYTVLNGTFFWELWQIMRIERWKEQYAASLPAWLDAIGRMDALLSLATFAYNHPEYAYPTLIDPAAETFRFHATALEGACDGDKGRVVIGVQRVEDHLRQSAVLCECIEERGHILYPGHTVDCIVPGIRAGFGIAGLICVAQASEVYLHHPALFCIFLRAGHGHHGLVYIPVCL